MKLRISNTCPLHLVQIDPDIAQPSYLFKHMDDYFLANRLRTEQSLLRPFYQPFFIDDQIAIQVQTDTGPVHWRIKDCSNKLILESAFDQKQQDKFDNSLFIYEAVIQCSDLDPGIYYVVLSFSGVEVMIGDPIEIFDELENTLLIEYTNSKYYRNTIFETGFEPSIRVMGMLRMRPPASKDSVYEDQVLDLVMIQSKPYRIWELLVGAFGPIPDWFIDKLNEALGCDQLKIDGRFYTKNDGSKWEEHDNVQNDALKIYSIELREMINRGAKDVDTTIDTNEEMLVMLNVSSKGFADTSSPDTTLLQIEDVE